MSDDFSAQAAYYVKKLKGSEAESDDAYQYLIQADHQIVPYLIATFRSEARPAIRAVLVKVIWQHGLPETVNFLSEALRDEHSRVWNNALDGLVSLGTKEALQVLVAVKESGHNSDSKTGWITEAIREVKEGLKT